MANKDKLTFGVETHRRTLQQNLALSGDSLAEYQQLYVSICIFALSCTDKVYFTLFSKAQASVLAVDERQALETLTREEKTLRRAATQLKEQLDGDIEQKKQKSEEKKVQTIKGQEVCSTN